MPANMMKAAVGSRLKVTGSSRATVSAGPIPGSTPTAVPRVTPTIAHNRLKGVSATAKPLASAPRVSMPQGSLMPAAGAILAKQLTEHAGWQNQPEPPREGHIGDGAQDE